MVFLDGVVVPKHFRHMSYRKGPSDVEKLIKSLSEHDSQRGVLLAFDVGEYKGLTRDNAVRGRALAELKHLIFALLSVRGDASILYSDLKHALTSVLHKYPEAAMGAISNKARSAASLGTAALYETK